MRNGSHARLRDRGVVRIAGPDSESFLQNIVTNDMARLAQGEPGFGALLSPQGKIQTDFLLVPDGDGFLLDLPLDRVPDFVKRMTLYRLRAKVTITDESAAREVVAFWGGEAPAIEGAVFADPRVAALGWRAILPKEAALAAAGSDEVDEAAYHAHRIRLGVPEAGRDFAFGDAFPHDADMDDLGGLDFRKGCYVGQEIVSRMQHRGTARRRAILASGAAALPPAGTSIEAGGRAVGALGSVDGSEGIALVRLDRARSAMDDGVPLVADGVTLTLALPAFAHFTWPEPGAGDEGAA